MEPRLVVATVASIVNPAVLMYMWHFVPWLLPWTLQTLLDTRVGESYSFMVHTDLTRPVCDMGRAVSYIYLVYCIARLIAVLVLGKRVQEGRRGTIMRAVGWCLYGAMLIGAFMLNVRAFVLMLITIPLEVVMDWAISGSVRGTAVSSSIALTASFVIGAAASFVTGSVYERMDDNWVAQYGKRRSTDNASRDYTSRISNNNNNRSSWAPYQQFKMPGNF